LDGALRPESSARDTAWEAGRVRVALDGRLTRRLSFQVEAELRDLEQPWRDVYLEWRTSGRLTLSAGRFKIPFGRDQLTPIHALDFIKRSRLGDQLAPARDSGVMASWKIMPKRWRLAAGWFAGDGDNGKTGGATAAARLLFSVGGGKKSAGRWGRAEAGLAAASSRLTPGLNSFRVRTSLGETWFSRIYAAGRRDRIGAEGEWRLGRWRASGEWMEASDQRKGQASTGGDLRPLRVRGGYAGAVYALRRGLEAAARWERITLGGGDPGYWPSRSARARNIFSNGESAWTAALNWAPERHWRMQFNMMRETIDDPRIGDKRLRSGRWLPFVRLQFVL
jgi:phosphate-selective porin